MKHLKKFNESQAEDLFYKLKREHPHASDEELEMLAGTPDVEQTKRETREEVIARYERDLEEVMRRNSSITTEFEPQLNDYLVAAGYEPVPTPEKAPEPEPEEEERPGLGGRIKNFLGFGK